DDADRLLRGARRGDDRAATKPRPRHHPAAGAGDGVPLSYLAVPHPPRRRLARPRVRRKPRRLGEPQRPLEVLGRRPACRLEEVPEPRNPPGGRQGVEERIMLRALLRRADMMVILENKLDALVRLHTPWPPGLIGWPHQYDIQSNLAPESLSGPNAGLTEVLVPAGYITTVYDPVFGLSPDGTRYVSRPTTTPTTISEPGLPFSLVFRC